MASGDEIMDEISDAYEEDFKRKKIGAACRFAYDHGPLAAAMRGDMEACEQVMRRLDAFLLDRGLTITHAKTR